ncbi:MAG: RNA polymerase sigma factor [Lachnospiraceae bacterium]|nr:RNA polymerase sigma factor [Lachnospiraceae bacterium]
MDGIVDGAVNAVMDEEGDNTKRHNILYEDSHINDVFIKTVRENQTAMFRLAYSIVGNKEDAEDTVSEAILKAFTHLGELRKRKKMKAWLFQILVNESKTCLKKRNRMELREDICGFEGKEKVPSYGLFEFVNQLEDIHKEVVLLFYFEEFNIKEIAGILDISVGTVKSRLSRARGKLKMFLEKDHSWKG